MAKITSFEWEIQNFASDNPSFKTAQNSEAVEDGDVEVIGVFSRRCPVRLGGMRSATDAGTP
jgi:hypothetical protein